MIYNLLIGGAAGQGMETIASVLAKLLKRKGFDVFTLQDYMSRVRGGHNFFKICFGNEEINSHSDKIDGIIALNSNTISLHIDDLNESGFIIVDEEIDYDDNRIIKLPLKTIAKKIGNPKVFGNVALGVIIKLFNLDLNYVEELTNEKFKPEIAKENLVAFEEGYKLGDVMFSIKAKSKDNKILVNGNEAIALGALAAGCKFYSAYPMTPSTSIMNYLSSKIKQAEIVVEQAEDEIAAINMAIGASYAGARSMTGTSGGISHNFVMVDSDEHDEYEHITDSASIRVQMNDKRLRKMEFLKKELIEPEFIGQDNFDTLLVGWGSLYSPIKEAVKLLNEDGKTKYSALIFGDVWPLPENLIKEKSNIAKDIINIEQNATGQLASLIRENTGIEFKNNILKYDGRPISAGDGDSGNN